MENHSDNHSTDKRFALSTWAVDNRATVMVMTVLIALIGFTAYNAMPREAFPEVVTPEIYVGTPYPGNAPGRHGEAGDPALGEGDQDDHRDR